MEGLSNSQACKVLARSSTSEIILWSTGYQIEYTKAWWLV
jgi:hypothetical protein